MMGSARLMLVAAAVCLLAAASCVARQAAPTQEANSRWNGLQPNPEAWAVGSQGGEEVLQHLSLDGCLVRMIRGGSDVPPGWTVENGWRSLGEIGYNTFEVRSAEGLLYVNYFYQPGGEPVNIGGFQVRPGAVPDACIAATEEVLSSLNPEGLVFLRPLSSGRAGVSFPQHPHRGWRGLSYKRWERAAVQPP